MAQTTSTPQTSQWLIPIVSGVSGLLGVVLGGFINYYVGSTLEAQKQRMQIQLSAFADFAKAQAAWQRAGAEKEEKQKEQAYSDASLKLRDAAYRIVIFSPPDVVKALAAFTEETRKGECNGPSGDITLYQIMRRRNPDYASTAEDVSRQDIALALFGCKLK